MEASLELQFVEAMRCVAAIRETNRSTAIDVECCFKAITDAHPLSVFEAYLAQRYKPYRVKAPVGNLYRTNTPVSNAEFFNLDRDVIREFDGRFFSQDQVRIGFRYSDDWGEITKFFASLLWHGAI